MFVKFIVAESACEDDTPRIERVEVYADSRCAQVMFVANVDPERASLQARASVERALQKLLEVRAIAA